MTRVLEAFGRAGVASFPEVRAFCEAAPRFLSVRERGSLYSLRYDKGSSDFRCPMVRQCRGIVLEQDTNKIVSWAFDKFYEYGEDAPTYRDRPNLRRSLGSEEAGARYERKYDGVLIKVVPSSSEKDGLLVSTNGLADAADAPVFGGQDVSQGQIANGGLSLRQIFAEAGGLSLPYKAGYCYAFELMHPALSTVTPASGVSMVHLMTRRLSGDYGELSPEDRFNIPSVVKPPEVLTCFQTFRDCSRAARLLPWDDEGYVVADSVGNRIKVKSDAYKAMQRLVVGDSSNADEDALVVAITLHRSRSPVRPDLAPLVTEWRERVESFAEVCASRLRVVHLASTSGGCSSARGTRASVEASLGGRLPRPVRTVLAGAVVGAKAKVSGEELTPNAVLDVLRSSRLTPCELLDTLRCWRTRPTRH